MRLVEDLSDEDLLAGPDPSLNPLLWVLGHVGHFYEAMILRPLCPGLELHTPGTLLHGYDVDGMFDSFRADHGDRWALEALQEAHGWEAIPPAHPAPGCEVAPDGAYPAVDRLVEGYLDRVRALCLQHIDAAPLDPEGR